MATELKFSNVVSQTVTNSQKEAMEIARLRSTNATYEAFKPEWDLCLGAYEGGAAFINAENLHKHNREHADDYKDRLKRAHYLNYCEPLVDFFTAFIFAETIQRNGGTNQAFYDEFINDVSLRGEDITAFMQQVSDDKQIYGHLYVLVDAPKQTSERPLTKAEEKKLGVRPYWVLIRPDEIFDWIVDPFDKLQYVKRQQIVETLEGYTQVVYEQYTEWFVDKIKITKIDITDPQKPQLLPPEIVNNEIGEIPIEIFRYQRDKRNLFMGKSFLRDLSMNNREIMNITSVLQEFLYRQCFSILTIQTDGQLSTQEQSEGEIGTANVMEYPKNAERPGYISPDVETAKFMQDERQRIVNEMYRRAAQDTINELFNGGKSSGFSKAQSFTTTVPRIASRAEVLEKGENRLMELTMKYMGKKWDGKVKYKDRYELTNITDAISQLSMLFRDLQMPSETFAKQELKRLVHEFDGKIPKEDMAKIESEIDQLDFKDFMETQKLALIGNAGNSPAEQQKPKESGTMAEHQAEAKVPNTSATKKLKK